MISNVSEGYRFVVTILEVERHPAGRHALEQLRDGFEIHENSNALVLVNKKGTLRIRLYEVGEVISAALRHVEERSKRTSNSRTTSPLDPPPDPPFPSGPLEGSHTVAELRQTITRLRAAGKTIIEQREQWKRRAAEAEEKLNDVGGIRLDGPNKNYDTLKRFLAKQFHPDQAPGSGIEKMIRGEMFKEIWNEIQRIDSD
jgi:hypothetical protein